MGLWFIFIVDLKGIYGQSDDFLIMAGLVWLSNQ